jgi:peptidoglycan/LPS O-acetylase OafA/YrhL
MKTTKSEFRDDIVVLRAVAVLLVLFNHFKFPGFQFGFIGVDIFFVISGYLITRILFKDYQKDFIKTGGKPGSIFLIAFYLRRIRRLLPAALVVIVILNLISWFNFNRPNQINRMIDLLREIEPGNLYFSFDGPRDQVDKILIDESISLIYKID